MLSFSNFLLIGFSILLRTLSMCDKSDEEFDDDDDEEEEWKEQADDDEDWNE